MGINPSVAAGDLLQGGIGEAETGEYTRKTSPGAPACGITRPCFAGL